MLFTFHWPKRADVVVAGAYLGFGCAEGKYEGIGFDGGRGWTVEIFREGTLVGAGTAP